MDPQDLSTAPLAGRWVRLLARLLDVVATGSVPLGLAMVGPVVADGDVRAMEAVLYVAMGWVALQIVVQAGMLGSRGQSIGKWALGIRIVDGDGRHPGWLRALVVREGAYWAFGALPKLGPWLSLASILAIYRHDRRTGHDHVAGTYVVRLPNGPGTSGSSADPAAVASREGPLRLDQVRTGPMGWTS